MDVVDREMVERELKPLRPWIEMAGMVAGEKEVPAVAVWGLAVRIPP
jgi:hypothetical protein